MRVFLDTNVLLDYLLQRENYTYAERVCFAVMANLYRFTTDGKTIRS